MCALHQLFSIFIKTRIRTNYRIMFQFTCTLATICMFLELFSYHCVIAVTSNLSTAISTTQANTGKSIFQSSMHIIHSHCMYVRIGTSLLTLSTAAVVGIVLSHVVVIAIAYTCGLLTGLLVRRRKNHTPSATGDLSAPTYEQVLPPSQTRISLKENEAYGQFNS